MASFRPRDFSRKIQPPKTFHRYGPVSRCERHLEMLLGWVKVFQDVIWVSRAGRVEVDGGSGDFFE